MPLARATCLALGLSLSLASAAVSAVAARSEPPADRADARSGLERLAGSLEVAIDLRGVDVTLSSGTLRIERLRAHLAPGAGGRPRLVVELDAPVLRSSTLPSLERLRWPRFDGEVVVHGGRVVIAGLPEIDHVETELSARVAARGRAGELQIRKLSARVATARGPREVRAQAGARWSLPRGTAHLDAPIAVAEHSRARLRADWSHGAVDVALDELSLAPDDLRAFAPELAPRRPVSGWLRARGPLDAIAVEAAVDPGRGHVALTGTVDARARVGRARVTLDQVELDFLPSATPMVLSASAQLVATRAGARFTVRGDYQHRAIDPQLAALHPAGGAAERERVTPLGPGGRLEGAGRLERRGDWTGRFAVRVHDPGAAERALAGRRAPPATLLVDGDYHKRGGRAGVLSVRTRAGAGDAR